MSIKSVTMNVSADSHIENAIAEALKLARAGECLVRFDFNRIEVVVGPKTNRRNLLRDFWRANRGYIPATVGPDPVPRLSAAVRAEEAALRALARAERAAARAAAKAKAKAARLALEAKLIGCPPMSRNEAKWKKGIAAQQGDDYGKTVADVASLTGREADVEGISGYMYSHACAALVATWKHGAKLKAWRERGY